ncbi:MULTISPECIES: hypothetical protein [Pseudomonas]|uniref:hypothetical protein n=1 Tax=Pseudomonas TaxID=286 RepID=UPI0025810A6C|nr:MULTISPECIES: hypothetical protein [Pseudomonas]
MDKLVFQNAPSVILGTNTFTNVPIVLQFDDTPLIQVVRTEQAGFTTEIPIYHEDGTYLTKVVGSRLFETSSAKKAGVTLEHHDKVTVCKLNGQVLYEIRREGAAALKTAAELYTPTGFFVKYTSSHPELINSAGSISKINQMITQCTFEGMRIGILLRSDGSLALGSN